MDSISSLIRDIEKIKTNHENSRKLRDRLVDELRFKNLIVLNSFFAEVLGENDEIKASDDIYGYPTSGNFCFDNDQYKNSIRYQIQLCLKGNTRSFDYINLKTHSIFDFKTQKLESFKTHLVGLKTSTSNEIEENHYMCIVGGKIAEIIEEKKEEIKNFMDEVSKELNISILESLKNIEKLAKELSKKKAELKEKCFVKFSKDCEKGIEFGSWEYITKNPTTDLQLKKFKITGYTPSGKTVKIKFNSIWEQDRKFLNEVTSDRFREFFENLYNQFGDPQIFVKNGYKMLNDKTF